jgi:hypothetical protein
MERLCRTVDRINPARVCGLYRGLGRGAFASDLASLCPLLQRHQNAPVTGQRRTGPSSHSADRRHRVIPDPRRTSSPVPVVNSMQLARDAESDDPLRDVGSLQNNYRDCPRSVPAARGVRSRDSPVAATDHRAATREWGAPRIHGELLRLGIDIGQTSVAMAKRHCRTSDRHTAPRVPGPNVDLWRVAPASRSFRLCGVLQSIAHALGITERRALASSRPTVRCHCRHSDSGLCVPKTSSVLIG